MAALLGLISIFSVIDLNSLVDKITITISPPLHSLSFPVSVCNSKIKPFGLTFHLCGAIEEERYCNELKYLPLFLMNADNFKILMTYAWVGLQYTVQFYSFVPWRMVQTELREIREIQRKKLSFSQNLTSFQWI